MWHATARHVVASKAKKGTFGFEKQGDRWFRFQLFRCESMIFQALKLFFSYMEVVILFNGEDATRSRVFFCLKEIITSSNSKECCSTMGVKWV